jgi:group I intron endonuclease
MVEVRADHDLSKTTLMPVIYKATNNLNNKSYIGYDSSWPRRKYIHLWESRTKSKDVVFHQALKRYSPEAFRWEILYESSDVDFTLNIMEGYFIRLHNSHYSTGQGYNMSFGGEGQVGFKHSTETLERFKKRVPWNKGLKTGPQPKEHSQKAANTRKGRMRGPYKGKQEYGSKYARAIYLKIPARTATNGPGPSIRVLGDS